MALFSKKTKTAKPSKEVVAKAEKTSGATYVTKHSLSSVIMSPRITEKSTFVAGKHNVYLFNIHKDAAKPHVAKAVKEIYGVTPLRVTIARTPAKRTFVRGKVGSNSAIKKAYVYLKEGDKIEFV
jgi:large subunit ribosomal protein L23